MPPSHPNLPSNSNRREVHSANDGPRRSYTNGTSSTASFDGTATSSAAAWNSPTMAHFELSPTTTTTHAASLVSHSAWTPAAWHAAEVEAPQLVLPQSHAQMPSTPPPTTALSAFEFGSTYDDDSYHDLDAVMALVTSSDFRSEEETNALALPRNPSTRWMSPAVRVGATDPLPRQYASTDETTEEATVLETTTSLYAAQWQQQTEDARLAANLREEDDLLLAMKLSAYEGGGTYSHNRRRMRPNELYLEDEHQEATVVAIADDDDYSRHRTPYASHNTVRAEWIGQDFDASERAAAAATASTYEPSHSTTQSSRATSATSVVEDDTREATVIDSAPLEKTDVADLTYTEEAQVLVDNSSHSNVDTNGNDSNEEDDPDFMDRKPAARPSRGTGRANNLEAEVVAIQERRDIHPAEQTFERAFQAELVGTDYSYTVAVPSSSQTSAVADRAAVLSSTRRVSRHHGMATVHSTAAMPAPPQAMAVVASADTETVVSTVAASAVPESQSDLDSDSFELGQLEEAHVFISEEESTNWDQKPAASLHGSHNRRNSRHASRSSTLPMIDEQEADIVSIPEHPEPLDDPRVQVVAVSNASEATPTATAILDQREVARLGHVTSASESSLQETVQIASPATTMGAIYNTWMAGPSNLFPDHLSHSLVLDDDIDVCENSIGEGFFVDGVHLADIVDIQEEEDIHPADLTTADLTETSAELVGSVVASNDGVLYEEEATPVSASAVLVPTVATEVIAMAELAEPMSTEVRHEHDSSVATIATAFLDPVVEHEQSDADEARALDKTPASQLSTPMSDELVHAPVSSEMTQSGINVAQPDFNIFTTNTPAIQPFATSARESSATTVESESNNTSSSQRSGLQSAASANIQMLSGTLTRGTSAVIDALFGGSPPPFVPKRTRSAEHDNTAVRAVSTRTLLPWSVINQKSSGMWIATLQTNQRALDKNDVVEASKSLRAFSMPSENQALSLARTWTPPRMLPFANHKVCHICKSKFAILRRACHCRNCGVCVCKDCVVPWPARMIPETYNIKKEHSVNACLSCNWLSNSFRLALLEGNRDQAIALHSTGNLNLHSPFANVKGELFFPVHCAVLGGSLELLKFLVDDNCCPIKSVRVAGSGKDSANRYTPIVTSKGRSLLGIAMENENLQILRYLVAEKGILLSGERDVTQDLLCRNLERLLKCIPSDSIVGHSPEAHGNTTIHALMRSETDDGSNHLGMNGNFDGQGPLTPIEANLRSSNQSSLNDEARDFGAITMRELYQRGIDGGGDLDLAVDEAIANEECIICFDRSIDCVATPCGHQICCLVCSENLDSRCPVCSSICSFMRIYKT